MTNDKGQSRRDFFRHAGRYAVLGVLGVGAVRLTAKQSAEPSRAGETCINQGVCRGCGAFRGCGLPPALSAKQALTGE